MNASQHPTEEDNDDDDDDDDIHISLLFLCLCVSSSSSSSSSSRWDEERTAARSNARVEYIKCRRLSILFTTRSRERERESRERIKISSTKNSLFSSFFDNSRTKSEKKSTFDLSLSLSPFVKKVF